MKGTVDVNVQEGATEKWNIEETQRVPRQRPQFENLDEKYSCAVFD
jgi:hypothetical protein